MTEAPDDHIPLPSTHVDNGILGRVPSQFIAQAEKTLPAATTAPDEEMCVEVDAAWAGRVKLTFKKIRYSRPKGKTSAVAWICRHAESVGTPSTQPAK